MRPGQANPANTPPALLHCLHLDQRFSGFLLILKGTFVQFVLVLVTRFQAH